MIRVLLIFVGVFSLNSASTSSLHSLLKRQADQDACNRALADNICTSGYYEDYSYILAQCLQRDTAESLQAACSVNGDGVRCSNFDVFSENFNDVCGNSPSTCSSGCRDLLNSMRTQLGCCVNALNDSSDNPEPLRYSLWSLCGIEAVSEQCTPSYSIPTSFPTVCNPATALEEIYGRVLCRTEFLDSLRNALIAAGCAGSLPNDEFSCGIFQDRYCGATNGPDVYGSLDAATRDCTNISVCEPACRQTLSNIISTDGCCFISQFNGTTPDQTYDFLSAEFWQLCGLTSPGICEQRFDDTPFRISNPSGTTTNPGGTTTNPGGTTTNPTAGAGTPSPTAGAPSQAAATTTGLIVATIIMVLVY